MAKVKQIVLRLSQIILLVQITGFATTRVSKPRTVNLALETVLEFDQEDQSKNVRFIEQIQSFLDTIKNAVPNNGKIELRTAKGEFQFVDFVENAIEIVLGYDDEVLEDMFVTLVNEIRKQRDDNKSERIINRNLGRFMTYNNKTLSKNNNAKSIKVILNQLLHSIQKTINVEKHTKLINFLNSLYQGESAEILNQVLKNLKMINSKRANFDLHKIIKDGVKAVFFSDKMLDQNADKNLKIKIETFSQDWSKDDKSWEVKASTVFDNDLSKNLLSSKNGNIYNLRAKNHKENVNKVIIEYTNTEKPKQKRYQSKHKKRRTYSKQSKTSSTLSNPDKIVTEKKNNNFKRVTRLGLRERMGTLWEEEIPLIRWKYQSRATKKNSSFSEFTNSIVLAKTLSEYEPYTTSSTQIRTNKRNYIKNKSNSKVNYKRNKIFSKSKAISYEDINTDKSIDTDISSNEGMEIETLEQTLILRRTDEKTVSLKNADTSKLSKNVNLNQTESKLDVFSKNINKNIISDSSRTIEISGSLEKVKEENKKLKQDSSNALLFQRYKNLTSNVKQVAAPAIETFTRNHEITSTIIFFNGNQFDEENLSKKSMDIINEEDKMKSLNTFSKKLQSINFTAQTVTYHNDKNNKNTNYYKQEQSFQLFSTPSISKHQENIQFRANGTEASGNYNLTVQNYTIDKAPEVQNQLNFDDSLEFLPKLKETEEIFKFPMFNNPHIISATTFKTPGPNVFQEYLKSQALSEPIEKVAEGIFKEKPKLNRNNFENLQTRASKPIFRNSDAEKYINTYKKSTTLGELNNTNAMMRKRVLETKIRNITASTYQITNILTSKKQTVPSRVTIPDVMINNNTLLTPRKYDGNLKKHNPSARPFVHILGTLVSKSEIDNDKLTPSLKMGSIIIKQKALTTNQVSTTKNVGKSILPFNILPVSSTPRNKSTNNITKQKVLSTRQVSITQNIGKSMLPTLRHKSTNISNKLDGKTKIETQVRVKRQNFKNKKPNNATRKAINKRKKNRRSNVKKSLIVYKNRRSNNVINENIIKKNKELEKELEDIMEVKEKTITTKKVKIRRYPIATTSIDPILELNKMFRRTDSPDLPDRDKIMKIHQRVLQDIQNLISPTVSTTTTTEADVHGEFKELDDAIELS